MKGRLSCWFSKGCLCIYESVKLMFKYIKNAWHFLFESTGYNLIESTGYNLTVQKNKDSLGHDT